MVFLIPRKKIVTGVGAAQLFVEHVCNHFGLPSMIISNRENGFAGHFWDSLWGMMNSCLKKRVYPLSIHKHTGDRWSTGLWFTHYGDIILDFPRLGMWVYHTFSLPSIHRHTSDKKSTGLWFTCYGDIILDIPGIGMRVYHTFSLLSTERCMGLQESCCLRDAMSSCLLVRLIWCSLVVYPQRAKKGVKLVGINISCEDFTDTCDNWSTIEEVTG